MGLGEVMDAGFDLGVERMLVHPGSESPAVGTREMYVIDDVRFPGTDIVSATAHDGGVWGKAAIYGLDTKDDGPVRRGWAIGLADGRALFGRLYREAVTLLPPEEGAVALAVARNHPDHEVPVRLVLGRKDDPRRTAFLKDVVTSHLVKAAGIDPNHYIGDIHLKVGSFRDTMSAEDSRRSVWYKVLV